MAQLDEIDRASVREIVDNYAKAESVYYWSDYLTELADGLVPIYNNKIVDEWQGLDYQDWNCGVQEYGLGEETDIITLMRLDLYRVYNNLVSEYAFKYAREIDIELF